MEVFLNFYSKTILILAILLSFDSYALDIKGVYLSSCKRIAGTIVKSSTSYIEMFTLNGKTQRVPRYEIVGVSSYPLESFPIENLKVDKRIDIYAFKTKYKNKIVDLVEGWPIAYSKDKVSVLSTKGEEIPFSRDNIWDIERSSSKAEYKLTKVNVRYRYNLLHPVGLRKCPSNYYGKGKKIVEVAPQEFISDPIEIKRRLDFIKSEKVLLDMYVRSKDFYAVPQIYKNNTTLGLWVSGNSRHGASENRANNWAPILENQFSSGPYGYQHTFSTGAGPNSFFVHEEPQTQFYYRFKADYFHLGYYLDPTLILMGKRYRWFEDEMGSNEYRINDMNFIEVGFDYGSLSLLMQVSDEVQIGYKESETVFYDGQLTLPKFGLEFRNHRFGMNFLIGEASENVRSDDFANGSGYKIGKFDLKFLRVNYFRELNDTWKFHLSYISRNLNVNDFNTKTNTYYLLVDYKLSYKYIFKTYISDEHVVNDDKNYHFLKLGFNANLVF